MFLPLTTGTWKLPTEQEFNPLAETVFIFTFLEQPPSYRKFLSKIEYKVIFFLMYIASIMVSHP